MLTDHLNSVKKWPHFELPVPSSFCLKKKTIWEIYSIQPIFNAILTNDCPPGQTAAQGELLRQQNGEKMQLERELARTEQEAFDSTLNDLEQNRRKTVDSMMDNLALQLQGQFYDWLLFVVRLILNFMIHFMLHYRRLHCWSTPSSSSSSSVVAPI